jgi:hypothetical protein
LIARIDQFGINNGRVGIIAQKMRTSVLVENSHAAREGSDRGLCGGLPGQIDACTNIEFGWPCSPEKYPDSVSRRIGCPIRSTTRSLTLGSARFKSSVAFKIAAPPHRRADQRPETVRCV